MNSGSTPESSGIAQSLILKAATGAHLVRVFLDQVAHLVVGAIVAAVGLLVVALQAAAPIAAVTALRRSQLVGVGGTGLQVDHCGRGGVEFEGKKSELHAGKRRVKR